MQVPDSGADLVYFSLVRSQAFVWVVDLHSRALRDFLVHTDVPHLGQLLSQHLVLGHLARGLAKADELLL